MQRHVSRGECLQEIVLFPRALTHVSQLPAGSLQYPSLAAGAVYGSQRIRCRSILFPKGACGGPDQNFATLKNNPQLANGGESEMFETRLYSMPPSAKGAL